MIQYALEWSKCGNCFRIMPLTELCAENQQAFMENRMLPDWVLLMVSGKDEIDRMYESWRSRLGEHERDNMLRFRSIRGIL